MIGIIYSIKLLLYAHFQCLYSSHTSFPIAHIVSLLHQPKVPLSTLNVKRMFDIIRIPICENGENALALAEPKAYRIIK